MLEMLGGLTVELTSVTVLAPCPQAAEEATSPAIEAAVKRFTM